MRALLASFMVLILVSSCKNEDASDNNEGLTIDQVRYKGEYIHLGDAAVITTADDIYAVKVDDMVKELDEKSEEFKRTPYDMVQVVLTGELMPNPKKAETGEGWDQMLVIDKIIEVRKGKMSTVMQAPAQKQEEK